MSLGSGTSDDDARDAPGETIQRDIEEFAATFDTEDTLRKAVAQLLTKMGRLGVQVTHGVIERGKDILFHGPGGMGETRIYACVVKNHPITGNADSAHGAKNVLFQVEQAFDEPVTGSKGQEQRIDSVYVISPYDCSQLAMDSIRSRLQRVGQVDFVCGRRLFELFAEYWPQFLCFESNVLTSYLVSLRSEVEHDANLMNLFLSHNLRDAKSTPFPERYVPQHLEQCMSTVKFQALTVPEKGLVAGSIYYHDIDSLMVNLERVSRVARALSVVWHSSTHRTIEDALQETKSMLTGTWNALYAEHERQRSKEHGLKVLKRNLRLRMAVSDDAKSRYEHLCDFAQQVRAKLDTVTVGAGKFVQSNSSSGASLLADPAYLSYCAVLDTCIQCPELLESKVQVSTVKFADDLLHEFRGHLMVTAPAGYGKTSFCRWNVLEDASRLSQSTSDILPVYVPLHTLAQGQLGTFEEAFFKARNLRELLAFEETKTDRRNIRLYLDGLDEVPSKQKQADLMAIIKSGVEKYPSVQVVLTARDHLCGASLAWLPRVSLAELDNEQKHALISRWLTDEELRRAFTQQLIKVPAILNAMSVPLLATLTLAVYKNTRQLPSSTFRLYGMFVELLCGGWDLVKNIQRDQRFGLAVKQTILIRLAGIMHQDGQRECSESQIRLAIQGTLAALVGQWERILEEMLQDGLLVRIGTSLGFAHLSFQEYLASRELEDPNAQKQTRILKSFLSGNDWWKEVLAFYIAGADNPQAVETWVATAGGRGQLTAASDWRARMEYLQSQLASSHPHFVPRSIGLTGRRAYFLDASTDEAAE